jgi:DnaK suppressor protein
MTDTKARNLELKKILTKHRREMQRDVRGRVRDGRADRASDVRDEVEHSDDASQGDIELSLLQMRAATLGRIDEALVRLEAGKFGFCVECDDQISAPRLRAMPFAVRCQTCEQQREEEQGRARRVVHHRGGSLFPNALSS